MRCVFIVILQIFLRIGNLCYFDKYNYKLLIEGLNVNCILTLLYMYIFLRQ